MSTSAQTPTIGRPERKTASRYGARLKTLSTLLILTFASQDLVHAQGGKAFWSQAAELQKPAPTPLSDSSDFQNIAVSRSLGVTHKMVEGDSERIIINIQDAHSKLGAQEGISRILDDLVKNYDLNFVAVEGASGAVDTSLVSSFPIDAVRKKTGEFLLKEGKISAGEFYLMISGEPMQLYGAEDPELYHENMEAFKELLENKAEIRKQLSGIQRGVQELQARIFAPNVQTMIQAKRLYKRGGTEFLEYWKDLKALAGPVGVDEKNFPNLSKLGAASEMEKSIDFGRATLEREFLLDRAAAGMPQAELRELLVKAQAFKQDKITPGSFYAYLIRVSQNAKIDPLLYKELTRYAQYLALYEGLDVASVLAEAETAEQQILEKYLTREDEKALYRLTRNADILTKLLDAALSSRDYEYYKANAASCEVSPLRNQLRALGEKYDVPTETYVDFGALESSLPSAKKFYELASRRNQTLLENTLQRMKKENIRMAALVTGGFHSDGISKLMDEDRLSYLVVMPTFDAQSPDRPYIAIITRKPKEYEEQFKDSEFYIAAANYASLSDRFNRLMHAPDQKINPDFAEYPELSFAAILGSYRLNGLGNRLPPEIQKEFYENVKRKQAEQGGGIVALDRLESWLKTARIRMENGYFNLTFQDSDGTQKSFRVHRGKDGKIHQIESRQEKDVLRPVAASVVDLIRGGIPPHPEKWNSPGARLAGPKRPRAPTSQPSAVRPSPPTLPLYFESLKQNLITLQKQSRMGTQRRAAVFVDTTLTDLKKDLAAELNRLDRSWFGIFQKRKKENIRNRLSSLRREIVAVRRRIAQPHSDTMEPAALSRWFSARRPVFRKIFGTEGPQRGRPDPLGDLLERLSRIQKHSDDRMLEVVRRELVSKKNKKAPPEQIALLEKILPHPESDPEPRQILADINEILKDLSSAPNAVAPKRPSFSKNKKTSIPTPSRTSVTDEMKKEERIKAERIKKVHALIVAFRGRWTRVKSPADLLKMKREWTAAVKKYEAFLGAADPQVAAVNAEIRAHQDRFKKLLRAEKEMVRYGRLAYRTASYREFLRAEKNFYALLKVLRGQNVSDRRYRAAQLQLLSKKVRFIRKAASTAAPGSAQGFLELLKAIHQNLKSLAPSEDSKNSAEYREVTRLIRSSLKVISVRASETRKVQKAAQLSQPATDASAASTITDLGSTAFGGDKDTVVMKRVARVATAGAGRMQQSIDDMRRLHLKRKMQQSINEMRDLQKKLQTSRTGGARLALTAGEKEKIILKAMDLTEKVKAIFESIPAHTQSSQTRESLKKVNQLMSETKEVLTSIASEEDEEMKALFKILKRTLKDMRFLAGDIKQILFLDQFPESPESDPSVAPATDAKKSLSTQTFRILNALKRPALFLLLTVLTYNLGSSLMTRASKPLPVDTRPVPSTGPPLLGAMPLPADIYLAPHGAELPPAVFDPGQGWLRQSDQMQGLRADMLDHAFRLRAGIAPDGNAAAEIPQLARDQNGLPILTRAIDGTAHLVHADGKTAVPITDAGQQAHFKATGRFYNDPARPFAIADLSGMTFRMARAGNRETPLPRFNGEAPIGINGQPIPVGPIFYPKKEADNLVLGIRDAEGAAIPALPKGAAPHEYSHYNTATGNPVVFLDPQAGLAKARREMATLLRRIDLPREFEKNPNLAAVQVDEEFVIQGRILKLESLPLRLIYPRRPDGSLGKPYLSSDLTRGIPPEGSVHRVAVRQPGGNFVPGNEIVFNPMSEEVAAAIQSTYQDTLVRALGTWSTLSLLTEEEQRRANENVRPVYAIVVKGTEAGGIQEYYEIPSMLAMTPGSERTKWQRSGANPKILKMLDLNNGEMDPKNKGIVSVMDGKVTQLDLGAGYTLYTSNNGSFERFMLMQDQKIRKESDIIARQYDSKGTVIRIFNASSGRDVLDLKKLAKAAKAKPTAHAFHVVVNDQNTFIEKSAVVRSVLAVQVSPDLKTRSRIFWSDRPDDARELARLRGLPAKKHENPFGFQIHEPANAAAHDSWIVTSNMGYEIAEDGRVTVYESPLEMRDRYRVRQADGSELAYRLRYLLADGTVVPWHLVRKSDVVIHTIDPVTKSRIFAGSEFLRTMYALKLLPMQAKMLDPGRTAQERTNSKVIFQDFAGFGTEVISIDSRIGQRALLAMEEYRLRLGDEYREIESRDGIDAEQKARLLRDLETKANFILESGRVVLDAASVLHEASTVEMRAWSEEKLAALRRQLAYESVLSSGGIVMTSNGLSFNRLSLLMQMNQEWGGDRTSVAFPEWVGPGKVERNIFRTVLKSMVEIEQKRVFKNPPETQFRIHDDKKDPVVETSLKEYALYLEEMRRELAAKKIALEAATADLAGKKPAARRTALRDIYRLGIERDMLERRIQDASVPQDSDSPRRLVYFRHSHPEKQAQEDASLKNRGTSDFVQVVIVPNPASAEEASEQAAQLTQNRIGYLKDTAAALERGGMRVSAPADPTRSHVVVRDPASPKSLAEIAAWEAVISQKVSQLEKVRQKWLGLLRAGLDRTAVEKEMEILNQEFKDNTFRHVDAAGIFGPKGVLYVVESLAGVEAAKAEVAKNEKITQVSKDAWRMDGGGAVIRLKEGVPELLTEPEQVGAAQLRLAEKLKTAKEEYDALRANQAANPTQAEDPEDHPRRARDRRVLEFAKLLKSANRYEEGSETYIVIGGFYGAQHELAQALQADLGPDQALHLQRDTNGVLTGLSILWHWDGRRWAEDRVYEPYSPDELGRRRMKVTDLRADQVYFETFELANVRQGGNIFRQTRPLQRDVHIGTDAVKAPGRPDRAVENWTRTTHLSYLPDSVIPIRSLTTAYTREGGKVVEGETVFKRSLRVLKNGGPEATGQPVLVNGLYVYDVQFGEGAGTLKGLARMVGVDPVSGEERITFYPQLHSEGEAVVKVDAAQYDVRAYHEDPVTGQITLGAESEGSVRDTGHFVNGGKVFVRLDASGRFDRAYAVDANGVEVAAFFLRPQTLNGQRIKGVAVLGGKHTTSLLPAEVRTARHYPDDLPMDLTFYFDSEYRLRDREGQLIDGRAEAALAVGGVVSTGDAFSNFPSEYYSALPKNWRILEEISADGEFEKARVTDPLGKEVASVSPEKKSSNASNQQSFIVEFVSPDKERAMREGLPVRATYGAHKENGVYTIDEKASTTTQEYQMTVVRDRDADTLVDGDPRLGEHHVLNVISRNIGPRQKDAAKKYLHQGILELRNTLDLPTGPLNLDVTAVSIQNGGTSFHVSIKGRILVFNSSDTEGSVLISTRWNDQKGLDNAIEGYEFSQGLLFHIVADPLPITASQFGGLTQLTDRQRAYYDLQKIPYPKQLPADVVAELTQNGVPVDEATRLTRVSRFLKVNGTELPVDARYIRLGDPFMRNYAVEGSGHVRYIKQKDAQHPTISPGEVVLDTLKQAISRNTSFRFHNALRSEYVYEVLKTGASSDMRNPGIIIYNYRTHTVYEVYGVNFNGENLTATNTPYPHVLVSRDGFFLYSYDFQGVDYQEDLSTSTLYSKFNTHTWIDHEGAYGKKGSLYMLIAESVLSPQVRGQGASAFLFENGKLVAGGEGLISDEDGTSEIFTKNPSNPNDISLSDLVHERFFNSTPGRIAGMVGATNRDNLKKLSGQIQESGDALLPNDPESRPVEVTWDWKLWTIGHTWWGAGAALLVLSLVSAVWSGAVRFVRRWDKAGPRKNTDADRLDKNVFGDGARLAAGVTPGQKMVMAKELGSGLILGPHVPDADRPGIIRNHFQNNLGFTEEDADKIVRRYSFFQTGYGRLLKFLGLARDEIAFDDPELDPYRRPKAPSLTPTTALSDLKLAVYSKYPPALVVYDLLNQGLVSEDQIQAAVHAASSEDRHRGDLLWRLTVRSLLASAQNSLLSGPLRRKHILKLPLTPEANVLKYIIRHDLVPFAEIRALAAAHTDFAAFVEDLIVQKAIEPVFREVLAQTFSGQISPAASADVLRTVTADLLPALHHNPSLLRFLKDPLKTRDVVYMPHPVNRAVEAVTLREFILLKFLQRSPSETNGHSIGQFSAIWPYAIHVTRRVNQAILDGKSPQETLALIDAMNGAFLPTVQREFDRYKLITGRDQWRSVEEHAVELVKKALRERGNKPLKDILTPIRKALLGRPEAVAARVEAILRADEAYPEEKLLTIVRQGLNRIQLVDLFTELDLWDLFEFASTQADDARRSGQPILTIEEQIAKTTGGAVKSLAQMAQSARGADEDEKTALARDFKGTTLRLMTQDHPEAVTADLQTKRPASWLMIAGTGLLTLYFERILKPLFSLEKFWGMGGWQKAGFFITFTALVAGGVSLIVFMPKFLAAGVFLNLLAPTFMPILWSGMPAKEKAWWGLSVAGGSAFYVGAILVFFLLSGLPLPAVFTWGFVFTVFLVALTYPVTVVSFHNLVTPVRSYAALHQELWSHEARALSGWRSFSPFQGMIGAFFSTRFAKSERNATVMKLAIPLSFVAGVAVGSLFWAIGVFAALVPLLHVVHRSATRWDIPEFWEKKFGAWFREMRHVEEHHRSPVPNGESVSEYLERLIQTLHKRHLISTEEAQLWLAAVHGRPGGRFVRPASAKAFEILKMTFFTLSQKKPAPDAWPLLQASSSHVQLRDEIFTHTVENSVVLGTFGDNASFLGYVARTHPTEWENMVERLAGRNLRLETFSQELAVTGPEGIHEKTDFAGLIDAASYLTPEDKQTLYREFVRWLNEMRPNNHAVLDSLAQDHLEYHLLLAYESGDLAYRDAVRSVGGKYESLSEAYRILSKKSPADLKSGETVFLRGYPAVQRRVDWKLRGIFQDVGIWKNIKADTGGKNITQVKPLNSLLASLEAYKDKLPAEDPVRTEVERVIVELGEFDPARAGTAALTVSGTAGASKFTTLENWSRQFLAWRRENLDAWVFLIQTMDREADAPLVPVDPAGKKPKDFMNTLVQTAETVVKARRSNIVYAFHEDAKDDVLAAHPGKHQQIALDLKSFFGATVNYDAHVMNEHGQHLFRPVWASMNSRLRNPQLAAINPMMVVWASLNDAFPATMFYSISQVVWTSDVQRAFRGRLLDYGKYMGIPQTVGPFLPPGEDSEGLLMLQRSARRSGVFYTGTQIDWFAFRWGRPSLFAESLATTEMRYAFNVTRFLMDRSSFAVFYNPRVPADVKLTHLFLWSHYFVPVIAIALLTLLPSFSPFSSFAFLKPLLFFVPASFILMEAVNAANLLRHWRVTGNFWEASYLLLRDVILSLPVNVALIPFFFRGAWLASREMFTFLRTVKEPLLASWSERQRFEELMLFRMFNERGVPLNNLISIAGLVAYVVGFVAMTPLAPVLLMPYLLSALAFSTGIYTIDAFKDKKNGLLYGYSFWKIFTRFPAAMRRMVFHLRTANETSEAAARQKALNHGMQKIELEKSGPSEAVRPSNVDEKIEKRQKALARAARVGEEQLIPDALRPDFRTQTAAQIEAWASVNEIEGAVRSGTRALPPGLQQKVSGARLAEEKSGSRLAEPTFPGIQSAHVHPSSIEPGYFKPAPLPAKVVVGAVEDTGSNAGYQPVNLWTTLQSRPAFQYQFTVVDVKSVPGFVSQTRSPFNVVVDPSAQEDSEELLRHLDEVLKKRDHATRRQIQKKRAEIRQAKRLLEAASDIFESTPESESELLAAGDRTIRGLRRDLRRIQLPPAVPVTLRIDGSGVKILSPSGRAMTLDSSEKNLKLNLETHLGLNLEKNFERVEKSFSDALARPEDAAAAVNAWRESAVLSSRYLSSGTEEAFNRRIDRWVRSVARFYKKVLDSQTRLNTEAIPAAQLTGTIVLLTHSSILERDEADYLRQLRDLDRQVEAINRQKASDAAALKIEHVLLLTDDRFDLARHPAAASFFGKSGIVREPGVDLKDIQRKHPDLFETRSVTLAGEGALPGNFERVHAIQPILIQLSSEATQLKGLPQTGVRLALSDGQAAGIPGLEPLGRGVFRWMPILQKLGEFIREARQSLTALGTSV